MSDPTPPTITFNDFAKVDIRVGCITRAERIPKKDRLLKLTVELGESTGPRTIIAGIAKSFPDPDVLAGTRTMFVVNLEPRDFGNGLVSYGMILACGPSAEALHLPSTGDTAVGSRVG